MILDKNTIRYSESDKHKCLEDLEQLKTLRTINTMSLDYCGCEKCEPGYGFGPAIRNDYLIHVVISGKGYFEVGDEHYDLGPNDAFVIRPGQETYYRADNHDPWTYLWIGFQGNKSETLLKQIGFFQNISIIRLNNVGEIYNKLMELYTYKNISYANELKRQSCFFSILAYLIEGNTNHQSSSESTENDSMYVSAAIDIINVSYKSKVKISDVANQIGINRSYLSNLFKKEIGISPQEYLVNLRLEKAEKMLRETRRSIGMVASEVGYVDSLAFSKSFKQKYGLSPNNYRKKCLVEEYGNLEED